MKTNAVRRYSADKAETYAAPRRFLHPDIPPDASAAEWATAWAQAAGVEPESASYLQAVERWRQVFKPERVRVVLVAESHVAERPGDASVRVRMPEGTGLKPLVVPESYVRLVYCLGYGESELCSTKPRTNAGTVQFWDLFGVLAGGENNLQPRRAAGSFHERLSWKLEVLAALSERGIWLLDAAVAGFYIPGGGRPFRGSLYTAMLRDSYRRFVEPLVERERPEQVWVIGRGVGTALAGFSSIDPVRVVSQPNDHNRSRYLADRAYLVSSLKENS